MSSIDLVQLVGQAREIGASGEHSSHLSTASCALVRHALDVDPAAPTETLVAPVASSRNPYDDRLVATASGRSWMIVGAIAHVSDAVGADSLLTIVRSRPIAGRERGLRVYRVPINAAGLAIAPLQTIDEDNAADISFNGVQVPDDLAVGPSRDATRAVESALDAITLLVVAEMLGAADAARLTAMRWVTSRVQFGEPLARRQSVAHRVADMTLACDAVALLLADALESADPSGGGPDPVAVTVAKLAANDKLPAVTAHAHQLHGGEGYYADRPLHGWHRRVTSLASQHGSSRVLRGRLADLLGRGRNV